MDPLIETPSEATMPVRSVGKQRLRRLHLWLGLPAASFLFLVGASGALLAFREPLDGLLNPKLTRVRVQGSRLPLDSIVERLNKVHPGYTVGQLNLPEAPEAELDALLYIPGQSRPLILAVNPYTGEVLGDWDNANHFMDRVLDLHKTLLIRKGGEGVVKLLALVLLALTISGLFLAWRRRRFRPSPGVPARTRWLDWHSLIGVSSALFLALAAFTAVAPVPFGRVMRQLPRFPEPQHPQASSTLPASQLLAAAQKAVPDATPTWLDLFWQPHHGGAVVAFRYPGDRSLMGQTHVHLDPYTGQVLEVRTPQRQSVLINWALTWKRELHTGTLFGWPSRVVACLTGVALAVLAASGPVAWFKGRKK